MPQATDNSGYLKNCVARALYDNIGESPDELAFRRGDLLTVLEQNTGGIEGWWLCTLRGRQGICPGNRLRLLAGVFDTGGGNLVAEDEADEDLESLQRLGKRRSWHVQSNKVVTPQRVGDVYLYDLPPTGSQNRPAPQHWQQQTSGDSYDVPRAGALAVAAAQCYDAPRGSPVPLDQGGLDCSSYDVPRAHCTPVIPPPPQYEYDTPPPAPRLTPSSSASSLTAPTTESGSNRSSGMDHVQYDIPPPPVKAIHSEPCPQVHPATFLYDVPPTVTKDVSNPAGLPLEQSAALETLSKLENELQAATTKLLGFVSPNWRLKENLEPKILELKLASHRVKTALHDLLRFCEGALGNAINAADRGLAPKLRLLLRMLRNSEQVLSESTTVLDRSDWNYFNLIRSDEMSQENPDSLDRLISNCKEIPDNTRQACGFIQGNAPLLFKRENEMPSGEEISGIEDYDYVNLESKTSVARSNSETKANLAPQLRDQYESLLSSDMEVLNLDPSDKRVLIFFAAQAASHAANLTTAIDAFLLTIEQNQPPTSFLAHGKFVVLSAHKLVAIGDSVHRHVAASAVRSRVLQASNSLSDALASAVHKTKKAALHFPSVSAVQEMVDSVVDISHLARDLKLQISQAAHSG